MKKAKPFILGAVIILMFFVFRMLYDAWTLKGSPSSSSAETSRNSTKAESTAPDFTLTDLSGAQRSLSDYRGKVVVLNFWASWCGPCQSEMDDFEAYYKRIKDSDEVVMLMVNLTIGRETEADARAFIEKKGYTFPVLLDRDGSAGTAYQITGIPTTYIIDQDGSVYNVHMGVTTQEELRADVEALLS